jgi:hypothetical protein
MVGLWESYWDRSECPGPEICSGYWSGTGSDAEFIAGLGPSLGLGPQLRINKQIKITPEVTDWIAVAVGGREDGGGVRK